jgi:AraC-like DNA-binding protein
MDKVYKLKDFIKDGFPLAVILSGRHPDNPLHTHDFQELVVIFGGACSHLAGGSEYRVEAGDVFLITGSERHGYSGTKDLRLANILFDLQMLGLPLQDLRSLPGFLTLFELEPNLRRSHRFRSRLRLQEGDLKRVEEIVERLKHELDARVPGYKALCSGLLLELIAVLSRAKPETPTPEHRELWSLGGVLRRLELEPEVRPSLDALAKEARMSKRNFQRLFKEAVGESPMKRLLRIRLDRAAAALLCERGESVGRIAMRHGFYDGNYFARQFAKEYGVPPTEYRRRGGRGLS